MAGTPTHPVLPDSFLASRTEEGSEGLSPPYQFQDEGEIAHDEVENIIDEQPPFVNSIDYGASIPFAESGEDGAQHIDQMIEKQLEERELEGEITFINQGDVPHSLIEFEAMEVSQAVQ